MTWKRAFTLVELLVVIAIIGILIALLLPAVQAAREAARRSQCNNNLKQLALAAHNFHDTYKKFPTATHQHGLHDPGNPTGWSNNRHRWSYLTVLLPFIEQQALHDEFIKNHLGQTVPWNNTPLTFAKISAIICPSDGAANAVPSNARQPTSYHCNRGDYRLHYDWHECRGVFGRSDKKHHNMASIRDGTSNTMFVSECVVGVPGSNRVTEAFATGWNPGNGAAPSGCLARLQGDGTLSTPLQGGNWYCGNRWADSHSIYTQWHVVLPPNAPSCGNSGENWAMMTASSYHPGGVNTAFTDGSVQFMSETIDAGDPTVGESSLPTLVDPNRPQDYGGPSIRGVWGALGSSGGGEAVSLP